MENESRGKSILKSGLSVSFIVLIAKVLGFVKQMVFAWIFGANIETDMYVIAEGFVYPIAIVIFSSISVVLLSEYVYEKNEKKKNLLISNMHFVYVGISLIIILAMIVFAPFISKIIAMGYDATQLKLITRYIRFFSPIILIYCIMSINGAVLEGEKHFIPTKLQSIFMSIGVIIFALLFHKSIGIYSILIGIIVGCLIHMIYVTVCAHKWIKFVRPYPIHDTHVKKIIRLSIPLLIGNAITVLNTIIDKMIASELKEGAVSSLYYAQVVSHDIISAVVVNAIGTIFFAHFTELAANNKNNKFANMITDAISYLTILLGQVMILYIFSASNIVNLIFNHGKFNEQAVSMTSAVVLGYVLGFIPMAIREIYIKAHYAFQDTTAPMINGIIGAVLNAIFSYILARRLGTVGIALGTTISYVIIAILSIFTIRKHKLNINYSKIAFLMFKIIFAMIGSSVVFWVIKNVFTSERNLIWLITCVLSSIVYVLILKTLRCEEVEILWKQVFRKRGN